MTIDHIGVWLFEDVAWFRIIGRIAMPLFCMLVAYGVTKSRNPWKFALRLLVFAVAIQVFLNLYLERNLFATGWYNVFFTLGFGVAVASLLKTCARLIKKYGTEISIGRVLLVALTFIGVLTIVIIPVILETAWGVEIDYGIAGVLLVVMFYLAIQHSVKTLKIASPIILAIWCLMFGASVQWFAFLALPFIMVFVDKKLKISVIEKYAFYVFYPLHMVVIFLIHSAVF